MKKKKKAIVFTILSLFIIALLYIGVWLFYYYVIWMPHVVKEARYKIDKDSVARKTAYSIEPDERYDTYTISIPWFGSFNCSIKMSGAVGFDDDNYILKEDGDKEYPLHTMSGSDFNYHMIAPLNWKGHIKEYHFNVTPYSEKSCSKYNSSAEFLINKNGKLLNESDLSQKQIEMYEEANTEIKEIIEKANSRFNFDDYY